MRKERGFGDDDWAHRDFLFSFSTDDAGAVQTICATSVPNAPAAATCLAEELRTIRFQPTDRGSYIVHFFVE